MLGHKQLSQSPCGNRNFVLEKHIMLQLMIFAIPFICASIVRQLPNDTNIFCSLGYSDPFRGVFNLLIHLFICAPGIYLSSPLNISYYFKWLQLTFDLNFIFLLKLLQIFFCVQILHIWKTELLVYLVIIPVLLKRYLFHLQMIKKEYIFSCLFHCLRLNVVIVSHILYGLFSSFL